MEAYHQTQAPTLPSDAVHPQPSRAPRTDAQFSLKPTSPVRPLVSRNRLLAAFPREAWEALEPYTETRQLALGVFLHRRGDTIREIFFPLNALISVTITMRDGRTAETGVAGCQEMVGVNALMGDEETTNTEYMIQAAGEVVCAPAARLRALFEDNAAVRRVILKYTQAMLAQVSQNVACNGLHVLEQRYARWLLETRDRVGGGELRVTQEFISQMLSVRRAGVTEVANRFEDRGIVRQRRGRTVILEDALLEAAACECYQALTREYDRLLGPSLAATAD